MAKRAYESSCSSSSSDASSKKRKVTAATTDKWILKNDMDTIAYMVGHERSDSGSTDSHVSKLLSL